MSAPNADLAELLRSVALYRRLSAEDRQRLAAVSALKVYERGDEIFAEGDLPRSFLVIVDGRVKVIKSTPAGKEIILEIFGAGDPFGAVAVYEGYPFPASARALETTRCVVTPREAFFGLLEQHPSLVRGLLGGLTIRLMELTNRLADLTGARVEERLARLFLKKAEEIGRPERGGTFIPLPLSRQEIADLAGTTIETAIRVMSRWGKQGWVETAEDGFVILRREPLERLAGT